MSSQVSARPLPLLFSTQWRRIPGELKLRTLSYVIPHGEIITFRGFQRLSIQDRASSQQSSQIILALMLCPEVHGMMRKCFCRHFFAHNTIAIEHFTGTRINRVPHPPPFFRHQLRHLAVYIPYTDFQLTRFLAKIASVTLGMDNLRTLHVVINGEGDEWDRGFIIKDLEYMDSIELHTPMLQVSYTHDVSWECTQGVYTGSDGLPVSLLTALTIVQKPGKNVKSDLSHLERNCAGDHRWRNVFAWSTTMGGEDVQRHSRKSIRLVEE